MQENVCVTILCNLYNSRRVSLFYAHSRYLAFPHPPPPIKQNRGEQICFVEPSANAEVFGREFSDSITSHNTESYLRHGINITANQRLFFSF